MEMDSELYTASREGNEEFLRNLLNNTNDRSSDILLSQTVHQRNNIVHLASRFGHQSFISEAIWQHPILVRQANSKGDTPLHIASRFGHLNVVKLLIGQTHESPSSSAGVSGATNNDHNGSNSVSLVEIEEGLVALWRITNSEMGAALHEALRNGHEDVADHLLDLDPELGCSVNNAGESPLYLAAESCCEKVMKKILESTMSFSLAGPHGQNPLHAAARYCSEKIIKLLLKKRPELMKQQDQHGKTALHYAIEAYFLEMVTLLLNIDTSPVFIPDSDGLTPLLRASSMGWLVGIKAILKICPESIEVCDQNGRNALHLLQMVHYRHSKKFMSIPELRELINERDNQGNTPLHTALDNRNHLKVRLLLETNIVDVRAINREGFTALDICEEEWRLSLKKRIMWHHLTRKYKAPRGRKPNQFKVPSIGPSLLPDIIHPMTDFKQMANTLSVVAALLATVTFAAAFTMPGGYNSNLGKNLGVALLMKKFALWVFVLADTFAMCSSITVVFFLIWAMIGEPDLLQSLVLISQIVLKASLYGTLIAFMSGLYAVTAPEALWVAILVIIMGTIVPFIVMQIAAIYFANRIWRNLDYKSKQTFSQNSP